MTPEDLLPRYFHSLDTEDWTTMRELWHPDGEMRAPGARPRVGVEDVLGYFAHLFDPWKVHEDRPVRIIPSASGTSATVEVLFVGTMQDGREAQFDAVDVFDFEDGRIRKLSNWYDLVYVRKVVAGPRA